MKNILSRLDNLSVLPGIILFLVSSYGIFYVMSDEVLENGYPIPDSCYLLDSSVTVELAAENYKACKNKLIQEEVPISLQEQDQAIKRLTTSLNPQQDIGEVSWFSEDLTRKAFLDIFKEVRSEVGHQNLNHFPFVYFYYKTSRLYLSSFPYLILAVLFFARFRPSVMREPW